MSSYIYLVTIYLDTPLYLTDAQNDFISGGNTYIAGKLEINSSVVQKSTPSANDFSITLSAVDQTLVSAIANTDYKGKRCLVRRAEITPSEAGYLVDNIEIWLDGELNKYSYTNKPVESIIKLSVSSIFAAFEAIKKVDLTAKFADTINIDETIYWGKSAPTTNTNYGSNDSGLALPIDNTY